MAIEGEWRPATDGERAAVSLVAIRCGAHRDSDGCGAARPGCVQVMVPLEPIVVTFGEEFDHGSFKITDQRTWPRRWV